MKLLTFTHQQQTRIGAERDGKIVDLTSHFPDSSVRRLISENRIQEAAKVAADNSADINVADIDFELPVGDPQKIFCIGVNYMNRNAEYQDGSNAPEYPSLFMRTPMSFSAHDKDIYIPPESDQFDYEGEIVLVIGQGGRRISQAEAHQHIAGLTIMNEGSVRDWLRHAKFNVTQGKNFDRSGGLGPWIQTDLSAIDLTDMKIETKVNGEVRQSDTTASMAFPFARIIEYVSTFATLSPGDIIATGTPTGAGARFDPPKWLVPGDEVEVIVEGVGSLLNKVAAEPVNNPS